VEHETASKHALRYVYKYPDMGLFYQSLPEERCEPHSRSDLSCWCQPRGKPLPLGDLPQNAVPTVEAPHVFTDADFGNDKEFRKCISGMVKF
jgi:hypothetical protein